MNLDELKKHIFIVIGYEHYNPLGVIRSLGEKGIKPVAMILKQPIRIASKSKYIGKLYRINSNEDAIEILLREYSNEEYKPFVIPCDDNSTEIIDKNFNRLKEFFIIPNAGEDGRISKFMNKWEIMEFAKKNGLNVARSWKVKKGEIPNDVIYPLITKPLISYPNWKADYYICNSEDELQTAYNKIHGNDLILQQFIVKKSELTLYGLSCRQGELIELPFCAVPAYVVPGYYALKKQIKEFNDESLKSIFEKMILDISYEGIFDVDFIVDSNDKLWFLEINFRNSAFSYAITKLGFSIPLIWANSMLDQNILRPEIKIPSGYCAIAEAADFSQRVRKNKMISISGWIKDLMKVNCLLIWNKRDLVPVFSYWSGAIKLFLKKKIRGNR